MAVVKQRTKLYVRHTGLNRHDVGRVCILYLEIFVSEYEVGCTAFINLTIVMPSWIKRWYAGTMPVRCAWLFIAT
uniref:Uncharacterized protein n=1 Tax=Candidatus Nitrotoga fabula TaxID=2182327 RepID=A0A2X0SG90_9PROT|nr:protein of unknown function [Candidatus Nitrotoga fabula]